MEIGGRTVALLGGAGLVGQAVARQLFEHGPARLVVTALTREEAERGVAELEDDPARDPSTELIAAWGDLFLPQALKDRRRAELMEDDAARATLLDDLYHELTDDVVRRNAFGALILEYRPEIVIDCVNTATAFAYQNVFASADRLREQAREGAVDLDAVERHLSTLYLPQLIRHVQVALESMRQAGTRFYLKVGTAGTGGMGLNIPFTHSEERPSRVLLSKAGLAGAHTLLLYLMARTPDAPAVKEIKPTAAISWKRIAYGEVKRGGRAIEAFDCERALPMAEAFGDDGAAAASPVGRTIEGVYLDAGENGWFSPGEFEALTALGSMEFITPEEIADLAVHEIMGYPTGRDVVTALDGATAGPTYRAGVLREVALAEMERLEKEKGVRAVAYEMLGPPRLSKLLFEVEILSRLFRGVAEAAELDAAQTATTSGELVRQDDDLRVRILSIGLPIVLPDGTVLRGRDVKVAPERGQAADDPKLADNGWVDLRESNWARWKGRLGRIAADAKRPGPREGSRSDVVVNADQLRPGRIAAWVFRVEDEGERVKR